MSRKVEYYVSALSPTPEDLDILRLWTGIASLESKRRKVDVKFPTQEMAEDYLTLLNVLRLNSETKKI